MFRRRSGFARFVGKTFRLNVDVECLNVPRRRDRRRRGDKKENDSC